MDIMQTLHSGLLVDPTNSHQIAAACLKILTNNSIWDKMSQNGARPRLGPRESAAVVCLEGGGTVHVV